MGHVDATRRGIARAIALAISIVSFWSIACGVASSHGVGPPVPADAKEDAGPPTGERVRTEPGVRYVGSVRGQTGTSIAFDARSERMLVAGGTDAQVWALPTLQPVSGKRSAAEAIRTASIAPDGAAVLAAAGDEVAVWDAATGRRAFVLGHEKPVTSARFSADGRRIVTGSLDGAACVWDAPTGGLLRLRRHPGPVHRVDCSDDGSRVLSVARGVGVRRETKGYRTAAYVWDVETGRDVVRPLGLNDSAYSPDEAWLRPATMTGAGDRVAQIQFVDVSVFSLKRDKLARLWTLPVQASGLVAFSGSGRKVATGGSRTTRVFDVDTGELISLFNQTGNPPCRAVNVVFSGDEQIVLIAAEGRAVAWNLVTDKTLLRVVAKDRREVPAVAITPDNRTVAVGFASDGETFVWALPGTR